MGSRKVIAGTIAALLLCGIPAAARQDAPWVGTWELDPARSTSSGPDRYLRSRFEIEHWGEGIRVSYDMVGVRGGRSHMEWTGAFDGREYPVQGVDYVLTNAYRRLDPRRYEILVRVDGVLAATTRVEVSADRQTLTAVTNETGQSGETRTSTAAYTRR